MTIQEWRYQIASLNKKINSKEQTERESEDLKKKMEDQDISEKIKKIFGLEE
jgi:hypothetical protein